MDKGWWKGRTAARFEASQDSKPSAASSTKSVACISAKSMRFQNYSNDEMHHSTIRLTEQPPPPPPARRSQPVIVWFSTDQEQDSGSYYDTSEDDGEETEEDSTTDGESGTGLRDARYSSSNGGGGGATIRGSLSSGRVGDLAEGAGAGAGLDARGMGGKVAAAPWDTPNGGTEGDGGGGGEGNEPR